MQATDADQQRPLRTEAVERSSRFLFEIVEKLLQPINNLVVIVRRYFILSGKFSVRQAQWKVVKMEKIFFFPTGLKLHLQDMF